MEPSRCIFRRMPASKSMARVPPSGVGTSRRWYRTARVLRVLAAKMVCTCPLRMKSGLRYQSSQRASSGTRCSTRSIRGSPGSACTPSSVWPSLRRQASVLGKFASSCLSVPNERAAERPNGVTTRWSCTASGASSKCVRVVMLQEPSGPLPPSRGISQVYFSFDSRGGPARRTH